MRLFLVKVIDCVIDVTDFNRRQNLADLWHMHYWKYNTDILPSICD